MKRLSPRQTRRAIKDLGIERSLLEAFGLSDGARNLRYSFHKHSRHQLLAPKSGMLMVETRERLQVIAAPQAIWIPARVRHATTLGSAPALSMFFPVDQYVSPVAEPSQVAMTSLAWELLTEGAQGGAAVPRGIRRSLGDLLHYLCLKALSDPQGASLARPRSQELMRAVDKLLEHLDTIAPPELARRSGMSERTLRRRFLAETGIPTEKYLHQARMTKAMQLLTDGKDRSITNIALEVGYQNHSAFSAAFRRFTGASPREFRNGG
jgi:AraC-like DNA-binding protein